jgi:hypothetical protein
MMNYLLKLLMLGTFAFWATGLAKFVHVQIEHHGKIDCCDDDDDFDQESSCATDALTQHPNNQQSPDQHHHGCAICEMLAAMTVDRSTPPPCLTPTLDTIFILIVVDLHPPFLQFVYYSPARGPPVY